jgi:hypothetical protein
VVAGGEGKKEVAAAIVADGPDAREADGGSFG